MENKSEYHKYNAMLLSKDQPNKNLLKEQQTYADQHYKDDLFLRHNLLESNSRLDIEMTEAEKDELLQIKSIITTSYFV